MTAQLDGLRRLRDDARGAIAALQLDLAQAWGVASLKVRHHQQFGYLAELPPAPAEKLLREPPPGRPATSPRSTARPWRMASASPAPLWPTSTAGCPRPPRRRPRREKTIARHLRGLCLAAAPGIAAAAEALAEIDIHAAAAELAAEGGWCRPEITERADFCITAGRHPVVAAALARARARPSCRMTATSRRGGGSAC